MIERRAVVIDWPEPTLHLYLIADTHVGSVACYEDRIEKLASIIAGDPYGRIIGGGDYVEAITPADRRYDERELAHPVAPEHRDNMLYCQALRFVSLMECTRGQWLGLVLGNHEHVAAQRFYTNAASIIAERLGTRYIGGADQSGWFRIRWKRDENRTRAMTELYVIHGWGGGELRGGDALKMQRLLWRKDADILMMGHTHRPMVFPESVECLDRSGRVVERKRMGVIGFPLCGQHGYIARKGGNVQPPGYVRICLTYKTALMVETRVEMCEL